ncbi:MAG: heme exporter protein CcmB [Legionellales bacterium]|nr:MAG: heme exporter protein CcmB [Legionellales bacterium]
MYGLIKKELLIYYRNRNASILPVLFLLLVVSAFAVTLSGDMQLLSYISGHIVWVSSLLAILLSCNGVLQQEYNNGIIEQILLGAYALNIVILLKVVAHVVMVLVPMLLVAPLLAIMLELSANTIINIMLILLIGAPSLVVLGFLGAALTVALKHSGLLMAILVLPLYFPIIILGSSAIMQAGQGYDIAGQLALLLALLILSITLVPFAIALALKVSVTQ